MAEVLVALVRLLDFRPPSTFELLALFYPLSEQGKQDILFNEAILGVDLRGFTHARWRGHGPGGTRLDV